MRRNYDPIFRSDLLVWRIDDLRTNASAVAKLGNLSQPTVSRAMQGKSVTAKNLLILARALDLDPRYWFDFKIDPKRFHRAVLNGKGAR